MKSNKKFVILLEILVITFLVMSVVPVCGLSDSSADISAYPDIVNPGDEITVTYSGAPGFEFDLIAMYKVGDPNEWFDWGYYLAGEKSGTLSFTAPDEPGDYEFRLFEDDGYTDIARSNVVTVQEGTTVSTPTPTPTTPSEGGLVGYWNFNEGSGNIAYDRSGSGNDGTIHGATFVSGISGQALSFDGKDDHVSAPVDINPTVMPQMTITAWVRADDDSGGTIVSHDDGGFDRTIDIDTRGGGKGWSAFSGSWVVGYSPVTIGEWVFLAAVYDQSAETVKLYVNGALISEEKGKLGSGWDYINIGKNPSFGDYFSGTVDEVMIYNYDLSADEIKALYEGKESPAPSPTPAITSGKGDCNGDGKITSVDALCALRMAVGKRTEDLVMDVTGDGSVTSLDARKILRIAAGLEELP